MHVWAFVWDIPNVSRLNAQDLQELI
jgi:hypothetical protein